MAFGGPLMVRHDWFEIRKEKKGIGRYDTLELNQIIMINMVYF